MNRDSRSPTDADHTSRIYRATYRDHEISGTLSKLLPEGA